MRRHCDCVKCLLILVHWTHQIVQNQNSRLLAFVKKCFDICRHTFHKFNSFFQQNFEIWLVVGVVTVYNPLYSFSVFLFGSVPVNFIVTCISRLFSPSGLVRNKTCWQAPENAKGSSVPCFRLNPSMPFCFSYNIHTTAAFIL